MTTLYSATWPGAGGAAWPAVWSLSTPSTNFTQDGSGGGVITTTTATPSYANLNGTGAPTNFANGEVTGSLIANATGEAYIWLRCDGNPTAAANGYYLKIVPSGPYALVKSVSGVTATIGDSGATQVGDWTASAYNFRLRVKGSTVSASVWKVGTSEPSAWGITVTDTAVTAAGMLRLSSDSAGLATCAVTWKGLNQASTMVLTDAQGSSTLVMTAKATSVSTGTGGDNLLAPPFAGGNNILNELWNDAVDLTPWHAAPNGPWNVTVTGASLAIQQTNRGKLQVASSSLAAIFAVASGKNYATPTPVQIPTLADSEVVTAFNFDPAGATIDLYLALRYQGTGALTQGYLVNIKPSAGGDTTATGYLEYYPVGGPHTTLGTWTIKDVYGSNLLITPGTKYWCRFRVQGSRISCTIWADGLPEPKTWGLSVVNTSLPTAGYLAPLWQFHSSGSGGIVYFNNMSLGDLQASGPGMTGTAGSYSTGSAKALITPLLVSTGNSVSGSTRARLTKNTIWQTYPAYPNQTLSAFADSRSGGSARLIPPYFAKPNSYGQFAGVYYGGTPFAKPLNKVTLYQGTGSLVAVSSLSGSGFRITRSWSIIVADEIPTFELNTILASYRDTLGVVLPLDVIPTIRIIMTNATTGADTVVVPRAQMSQVGASNVWRYQWTPTVEGVYSIEIQSSWRAFGAQAFQPVTARSRYDFVAPELGYPDRMG